MAVGPGVAHFSHAAIGSSPPVVTPPRTRRFSSGPTDLGGLGVSANVSVFTEEDGLASLTPDARLVELRYKKDLLRAQVLQQPHDIRLLSRLAGVHVQLGEVSEFVSFATSICKTYHSAWRNVCRILRKLDRPQDVLPILLEVHEVEPGNAEVCCAIAKLDRRSQAHEWYEKALRIDPHCTEALLALADSYRKVDFNFAEAARLYKVAYEQRPAGKLLYRLGECLVQDGRGAEGRQYLKQVFSDRDRTFHLHAAVMLALSYTMAQDHAKALEFCQRAEDIYAAAPVAGSRNLMKHAWISKGITQLNDGHPELAVETLRSAGREALGADVDGSRWADEMIETYLGLAQTLRGDFTSAERHLEQACRLGLGPPVCPDVLVNQAYLKQVHGDFEAAQSLLHKCLETFNNNAVALLRMGYVLLCQDQHDQAAQFLQKCLLQPEGTLTYGVSQKGAAHLYLCIALHLRASERAQLPDVTTSIGGSAGIPARGSEDVVAEEQFRKGYELLPHLPHSLADLAAAPCRASRIGMMDLTAKQAAVLLFFAERCGLVPLGSFQQVSSTPSKKANLARMTAGYPQVPGAPPTLMGTASTAAPASCGPSRDASDHNLHGSGCPLGSDGAELEPWARIPSEKRLQFSELEIGDCISHGEYTVVHRGTLRDSRLEVVVKTLHQKECIHDEQAIAELQAEVAVISELSHPRLVTFVGACLETSQLALVTELAPGGNLHQALHVRHRRLSRHERFQLATELLEGVRYLHAQSPPVAHLDLKSMNLVLDAEGQHLQICDFGLARVLRPLLQHGQQEVEQAERVPSRGGSPRYMSPECYDSNLGAITEKADVWSSGCILIEIFGETQPYAECSNVQQILKLMLVHHCGPSVPETIEASVRSVIASTLAFEAQERLAIAQVLLQMQTIAKSNSGETKSRFMWIA